jgi:hypothetical protein
MLTSKNPGSIPEKKIRSNPYEQASIWLKDGLEYG